MADLLGLRTTGAIDNKAAATGASGGWPNAGLAMINSTEYSTVQLADTAAATGDIIKVGQGTDSGGVTVDEAVSIVGLSPRETILTHNVDTTVTVTAANATLEDLTVENTDASGTVNVVVVSADGLTLDNLVINKTSGANATSIGVSIGAGNTVGTLLRDSKIRVSQGSIVKWGVYLHTAASYLVIEGGEINGDTRDIYVDHASAVVELRGVKLLGGGIEIAAGTVRGWYYDASGNIRQVVTTNDIYLGGDEAGVKQRSINLGYATITDHFDSTFTGYTWAAYAGFGTPDNINVTNVPSHVQIYNNPATAAQRHFAYMASTGAIITARCYSLLEAMAGIRFDDGTNDNYVEYYLEAQALGTPAVLLRRRYAVATVVTGPTTLLTLPLAMEVVLSIDDQGASAVLFAHTNQMGRQAIATAPLAFTRSRSGIYFENTTTGGGADRAAVFDWYKQV